MLHTKTQGSAPTVSSSRRQKFAKNAPFVRSSTPPGLSRPPKDHNQKGGKTTKEIANNLVKMDAECPGVKDFLLEMVGAMSTEDKATNMRNIRVIAESIHMRLIEHFKRVKQAEQALKLRRTTGWKKGGAFDLSSRGAGEDDD